MTTDYKKYSLEKLQEWVHDTLSCGEASPHEIYSAIREAAQEDYQYYKDHSARAFGLLELLSGHRPVADYDLESVPEERKYYEGSNNTLSCDKDDSSPECKKSWTSFWEDSPYPMYVSEDGDVWIPDSVTKDKVKKWILPIEECKDGDTDETEYFVSFPEDLLEAANLKEGDQVEWVDQGDGSYLLKKVNNKPSWVEGNELAKVKTYDEMIAEGWEMTDDGFWIKSQAN